MEGYCGGFLFGGVMGKMSDRRKNHRQKYLSELAETDPQKFEAEWNKRLSSWSQEASRRAGKLTDKNGKPVPSVFAMETEVMSQLETYGPAARSLVVSTQECVTDFCCRAVAQRIDSRLYRPGNSKNNERLMKERAQQT